MRPPVKQIAYKYSVNFAKTEFPYRASVGQSGEKNKKDRPYISRISPGPPLRPIGTNFGFRVRLVDVINRAKFYRNRLRGLDSMSGQSLTIPIRLRYRR